MGQAKQRGTRESRVANAVAERKELEAKLDNLPIRERASLPSRNLSLLLSAALLGSTFTTTERRK